MSDCDFDRATEDVGNVQLLEHVNLTVPDQSIAALFYVTGLGFTRDPYIDFGTLNMWVNLGDQQFHLPTGSAQVLRGHVGVVVPSLEGLGKRLRFASKGLDGSAYRCTEHADHLQLSCPYGNQIKAWEPSAFESMRDMALGMAYIEFDVPVGTSDGIARFYSQVIGCAASASGGTALVPMGHNQVLRFVETDQPLPPYDGHHIAIYVADFSSPHSFLAGRNLVTEESDAHQYRFQHIVDPESDKVLFELEHEVRSLGHPMYRRELVNRNPESNFFTYKRGNERFSPG